MVGFKLGLIWNKPAGACIDVQYTAQRDKSQSEDTSDKTSFRKMLH